MRACYVCLRFCSQLSSIRPKPWFKRTIVCCWELYKGHFSNPKMWTWVLPLWANVFRPIKLGVFTGNRSFRWLLNVHIKIWKCLVPNWVTTLQVYFRFWRFLNISMILPHFFKAFLWYGLTVRRCKFIFGWEAGAELWRFCGCLNDWNIWVLIVDILWLVEGWEYLGLNSGGFVVVGRIGISGSE